MGKKFDWSDWTLEDLLDRVAYLRKGLDVRFPHVPEPDPDELSSIEEEILTREESEEVTGNDN